MAARPFLAWMFSLLIAVIAAALAPRPAAAQAIGGLEFFGDSNSDDGNAWRISGKVFPASPPYWQGSMTRWTGSIRKQ